MEGAGSVQAILDEASGVPLGVQAVWLPMYPGDARDRWSEALLPDRRAAHLWDGALVAGRWFARHAPPQGFHGEIAWDSFLLFGPEAEWRDAPGPVLASGFPVVRTRDALAAGVRAVSRRAAP